LPSLRKIFQGSFSATLAGNIAGGYAPLMVLETGVIGHPGYITSRLLHKEV